VPSQAPLFEQLPSPGQSIDVEVVVMMEVVVPLVGTALAVVGAVAKFGVSWVKVRF